MQRPQQISAGEVAVLLYNVFLSTTFLLPTGPRAGRDAWIAVLLAGAAGLGMAFVLGALARRFPGRGIVGYSRLLFGPWVGGLVGLLFVGYSMELGALVLRNFGEFVVTVLLPATPVLVPVLLIALLGAYAIRHGIEVLARASFVLGLMATLNILLGSLLVAGQMRWERLLPVLDQGWGPLFSAALPVFSYSYGEAVIGCQALSSVRPVSRARTGLVGAIILTTLVLTVLQVQDVTVLGVETVSVTQYPVLEVFKSIEVGNFLTRLDVLVSVNWIAGGFVKVAVALYSASEGLAEVFDLRSYRPLVLPIAAMMVALAAAIASNYTSLVEIAAVVWPFHSLPFQVILPLLLLAVAQVVRLRSSQDSQ